MIAIYRTSEMEKTARALGRRFKHTLVRAISILDNPVRIRAKELGDNVYVGRNADLGDRQIKAWLAKGGILVNYVYLPKKMPHEAQLLCECPLSMQEFWRFAEQTSKIMVVYQSPNWDEHRKAVARLNPEAIPCKMLHTMIRSADCDSEQIAMCNALNLPHTALGAIYDESLCAVLKVTPTELKRMRKFISNSRLGFGRFYFPVRRLVPLTPTEDKSLTKLYHRIKILPSVNGVHLALADVLKESHRYWKTALRALVREGSVKQLPILTFYKKDVKEPDYDWIQSGYETAQVRLAQMIQMVEEAPTFTSEIGRRVASRLARPAGLFQPRSVSTPVSSARTRGTAD